MGTRDRRARGLEGLVFGERVGNGAGKHQERKITAVCGNDEHRGQRVCRCDYTEQQSLLKNERGGVPKASGKRELRSTRRQREHGF